jgi:hypothetical protein
MTLSEELRRQIEFLREENAKLRKYHSAYEALRKPMGGIAVCATRCDCCQMLSRIATNAVKTAEDITGEHERWL